MEITIGFIGLGLIGGSIAKGIKRIHPEYKIMAYARNRATLEDAKKENTIDFILDEINENLSLCDIIYLCTPVAFNAQYLKAIKPFLSPTCIITDVGSTKTSIHNEIINLGLEEHFIGGHPMTGSERTGYHNSTDYLLENAYYVLTPALKSNQKNLDTIQQLVQELGALPIVLDYKEHDYVVAAISHLPHIIASSLVNLVRDSDTKQQTMKQVAAGGFKDITRIASSSPVMWQQICMSNRDNLANILKDYIAKLNSTLHDLESEDEQAIYQLFETSGEYRNSIIDKPTGLFNKEYSIYCDIIDQAGAIATIATTLAIHQISIKNIGIINNREFEQGVLKIEFYEETACIDAAEILKNCHYQLFKR